MITEAHGPIKNGMGPVRSTKKNADSLESELRLSIVNCLDLFCSKPHN